MPPYHKMIHAIEMKRWKDEAVLLIEHFFLFTWRKCWFSPQSQIMCFTVWLYPLCRCSYRMNKCMMLLFAYIRWEQKAPRGQNVFCGIFFTRFVHRCVGWEEWNTWWTCWTTRSSRSRRTLVAPWGTWSMGKPWTRTRSLWGTREESQLCSACWERLWTQKWGSLSQVCRPRMHLQFKHTKGILGNPNISDLHSFKTEKGDK